MFDNEKIVLQFGDYIVTELKANEKNFYRGYFKNSNNELVCCCIQDKTLEDAIFKTILCKKDSLTCIFRGESGNLFAESSCLLYIMRMLRD